MRGKTQEYRDGMIALTPEGQKSVVDSPLYNEDLRPVPIKERTWTAYNIAALWIGMSVCIPTYMLASGLIAAGMNWWQALLTIILGNVIVLIPMILNAHAGTKYGIPYPVFARLSFGTKGAHVPAILRAIVAAGWFGIQTWIGGAGVQALVSAMIPGWSNFTLGPVVSFLAFWALNVYIGYKGPEAIKFMESWGSPILIVMGLALLIWAYLAAGGLGPIVSQPDKFETTADFMKVFLPSLTGMIAFWATLALNIPDFSRFAVNQRAQMLGQALGLPTTMGFYAFIGVIVTSATVVVYGEAIWDPVVLMTKFPPLVVLIGTVGIVLATITTNIAANVVAPAIGISNLFPKKITFGMGTIITGLIGIAMCPWYLLANYGNYIFGWLGTYGGFLGPLAGIYICDYWIIRRQRIDLDDLYREEGKYAYGGSGVNWKAIIALVVGVLFALIGKIVPALGWLYANAWMVGALVGGVVYYFLMRNDSTILTEEYFRSITDGL
ncbi:MAG TPA: NCS1 family nucleobase:cation symporter-1 [Clostridia bacterium]|nr:NCS1 family nucleobase:cation symporter-1 [Clostridia bacterium]